ncbi:hypothetical protein [Neisseria cinerea]
MELQIDPSAVMDTRQSVFLGVADREMPSEHHSDGIWFVKVRRLQL